MDETLKVLIADDSIVYRKLLSDIVRNQEGMELIGVAPHGGIALLKIDLKKPDLVLLDVVMPEKDGLEVLEAINRRHADIDVVFVSGMSKENAEITVKALEMGALDFVPKPKTDSTQDSIDELTSVLIPILNLAKTRKYTRRARDPQVGKSIEKAAPSPVLKPIKTHPVQEKKPQKPAIKRKPPKIDVVTIGVSTGGPNALTNLLTHVKADLPVPILIVQHMPPTFTASLAERLNSITELKVVEAAAGTPLENGTVYIAPGGRHMIIRKHLSGKPIIGLNDSAPVHNCRPAVDVLFRSAAMIFNGNILSVVLTGMGSDGASGVAAIRRKGGYCIIQDENSSVVWGMPGAVMDAGEADEVLDLELIAKRIETLVQGG